MRLPIDTGRAHEDNIVYHMRRLRSTLVPAVVTTAFLLTSCGEDKTFPVRTYNMGDRVTIGHLIYTVFETQWLTHIGEGAEARVPQHRFFLVRMSAVNGGSGETLIPNVSLQDDAGNSYAELSNGEGVSQWIGFLRNVKPADSAQGNVLFDAPPRHYKLKVADESREQTALIDIPLNFSSETPDIPTPGADKKK
jgi:Domain of unknown function (DUF4352)